MDHKLIIFAGSSPGVGKSTLSSFLYKQLQLAGIKSRWFYEEDVTDESIFPGVVEAVTKIAPDVLDVLLRAAHTLVEECLKSEQIFITDSLLPFYNWLLHSNLEQAKIAAFSRELEKVLEPVNPLVVYLDADMAAAFQRALENRGVNYLNNAFNYLTNSAYYRARNIKVDNLSIVVDYFERQNELNLALLAEWRCAKLIFNTTTTDLAELKRRLLEELSLEEISLPTGPNRESLENLVGLYDKVGGINVPQTLQVTLPGEDLWVDTYWPDGCRLVALNSTKFQLQDTNYYLVFDQKYGGPVKGLTFIIGSKEHAYVKRI